MFYHLCSFAMLYKKHTSVKYVFITITVTMISISLLFTGLPFLLVQEHSNSSNTQDKFSNYISDSNEEVRADTSENNDLGIGLPSNTSEKNDSGMELDSYTSDTNTDASDTNLAEIEASVPITISYETLFYGESFGFKTKFQLVITDLATWQSYLAILEKGTVEEGGQISVEVPISDEVNPVTTQKNTFPEIDFETEMIVLVFSGTQSSGGHGVTITGVELIDQTLTVKSVMEIPLKDCSLAPQISHTTHVIKLPLTDFNAVDFQFSDQNYQC